MSLTNAELAAIEARCNEVDKGPWTREWIDATPGNHEDGDIEIIGSMGLRVALVEAEFPTHDQRPVVATAEFIAHAREDVPALLATCRALRAENDGLRAACVERDKLVREIEKAAYKCQDWSGTRLGDAFDAYEAATREERGA